MTPQLCARLVLLLCATAVLQVAVLDGVVIGGVHPDGFLVLAVAAGVVGGPRRGAAVAFVAGLVADLFVVTPFGLSSLCFVLVAFTAGLASGLSGDRAPYSFKVVTALVGGVAATLLYSVAGSLIGQPAVAHGQLAAIAAVVAAGCAVMIVPFAKAMSWVLADGTAGRRLAGASDARVTS